MPGSCGTALWAGLVVAWPHGAYLWLTAPMVAVPAWAGLPGRTGVGANVGCVSLTFRPVTVTAQITWLPAAPLLCTEDEPPGRLVTLPSAAGADRATIAPVTARAAAPALSRIVVFRLTD